MTMTQEWAEKIWRGGPEAFQIVRGLYADMVSKMDGFEQQAKLLLDACEKIPLVWIPVEERLPEEGVNVLAWLADRSRAVVAYRRDKWWDGTDEELNFHSYTKVDDAEAPTHWMPLPPEPPEVK
jgi:hypothetical protein